MIFFSPQTYSLWRKTSTTLLNQRRSVLKLNAAKCEIIMDNFSLIDSMEVFKEFIRLPKQEMTLLGPHLARPGSGQIYQDKGQLSR